MSALGDLLRAQAAAETAPASVFSHHEPVANSPDLERVLAIPRRQLGRIGRRAATAKYARAGGKMWLRPLQAHALAEAERAGGLISPAGVGEGKTLITLLLPLAMKATTTVLLVPPALREQLKAEYPVYAAHFNLPNMHGLPIRPGVRSKIYVVSYSELSSAKQNGAESILERLKPDLIIADEAHSLKATSAARTKRFLRYFKAHPNTKFCALSGTLTSKSIRDFAHLTRLALRSGAPVPFAWPVLEQWAGALDSSDFPAPPGDLVRLCRLGEDVRSGFRRRLVETPGVVASSNRGVPGVALYLKNRDLELDPVVAKALTDLRETWCTPGGEEITDALAFSRYARQLAAGLYYRWIWPRGEPEAVQEEWKEARKWWHREVRRFLQDSAKQGMDSPLLVAQAAARGTYASENWPRWAAIRGEARPDVEAVWVSDFMVRDAVEWGRKNEGSIIWYEHAALGEAIAKAGGFPHYGAGKEAGEALLQELADFGGRRTVVLSRKARGEGWNLQAFNNQLVTTPSSNGKTWEQLSGRTHREGQAADEVWCEVYGHTTEMRHAMQTARRDAQYIEACLGNPQRLNLATYV